MEDKESKFKQKKDTKIDKNCIFSKENVNTGHQPEFDYLKTILVVLIVLCHFYEEFSKNFVFEIVLFWSWIFKAGSLMMLMGIGMKYTRHHEPKDYFYRGTTLFTLGQYVNLIRDAIPNIIAFWATGNKNFLSRGMLIMQADILSFAGIAFIFFSVLKKMKLSDNCILIIAIIMNAVAFPLYKIMKPPKSFLLSQILGYFVLIDAEAFFPLCSYFIMVAFGYWIGGIYLKISNKDKFYNKIIIFGFPVVTICLYIRINYGFPMLPDFYTFEHYILLPGPDWVITCLTNIVALGFFYKLHKMLNEKTPEFVSHAGKNLNQYYIISYVSTVHIQTCVLVSKGDEYPFTMKNTTLIGFLLIIFCRVLIDINDKYIHFTIITLKNPTRKIVFALIWILNVICVIYIYPKLEAYACMWNNYLLPSHNDQYVK